MFMLLFTFQVQVAALEVQNVRKAISRYGTLPKGARIGAYLESLRQSGITSNQEPPQAINPVLAEQKESPPRPLSPRTSIRTQSQMIRSNSSSGVTTFHTPHPPNSPTASKLPRNRNMTRNSTNEAAPRNLSTFKVAQGQSSFRGGSPSRSVQPTLADLEFPPPPDLPPPPEEFNGPMEPTADCFVMVSSTESKRKRVPISPLTSRKLAEDMDNGIDCIDVSNLEPSVEEASSRFGVSLKKREASVDSCNSAKDDRDDDKDKSPQRTSMSLTSPSVEGKSPMSVDSDVPVIGSPLEPLPPPPLFPDIGNVEMLFIQSLCDV